MHRSVKPAIFFGSKGFPGIAQLPQNAAKLNSWQLTNSPLPIIPNHRMQVKQRAIASLAFSCPKRPQQ